MMTQKPSSFISKLKYGGVIPVLLLAIIVFSFREKEQKEMVHTAKITISSDILLGTLNIPPGSVQVKVGGQQLKENEDYVIDYNLGRIKILNQAYLQPNIPINVSFDDNAFQHVEESYFPTELNNEENPSQTSPAKEADTNKIYNIYKDGLRIYGFDNTEQPLFPGCEKVNEMEKADCSHNKLFEYVSQHLKYPEEMKAQKLVGKVYVKFVITSNGYVAEAKIQKSLNPAADKAALDVVNGMNDNVGKWTPGTKEGIPVTMDMVLPISFELGGGSEQNSKTTTNSATDSTSKSSPEVYTYVEEMPRFPGCDSDFSSGDCAAIMYKYIAENIRYPDEDRKNGKEGTVMAQFTVEADGHISDAKILRGITPNMDAEVLRMVNNMNNMPQLWIPGKKDGKPVAVSFTMPVKFVLQSKNKEAAQPAEPMKGASSQVEENNPGTLHNASNEKDQSATPGLHLLPNPTRDHVIVELFEGAKTIFVYDAGGIQLADIDVSKLNDPHYRLDVSRYPAGQYSVQLISSTKSLSGAFTVIK